MSDKQLEKLLDGFVQSSQCVTALQEGILSLHGVMEQFQQATEDFNLKNEMNILLPKVKEHFVQVDGMYATIADHIATIKENTLQIQATGEEMIPAYQKLQREVGLLQEMQSEMVTTVRAINGSVQEMQGMQQELRLQMVEFRQMMETKNMQQELVSQEKNEIK